MINALLVIAYLIIGMIVSVIAIWLEPPYLRDYLISGVLITVWPFYLCAMTLGGFGYLVGRIIRRGVAFLDQLEIKWLKNAEKKQ